MSTNHAILPPDGDFIISRDRGAMRIEAAPPVVDPPDVGPATDLQRAEAQRISEKRQKENEARALALRAKAEKGHRRTA